MNNWARYFKTSENQDGYYKENGTIGLKYNTLIVEVFDEKYYSYEKWGEIFEIKENDQYINETKRYELNRCAEELEKVTKRYAIKANKQLGKKFKLDGFKRKKVTFTRWFNCNPNDLIEKTKGMKCNWTALNVDYEE